MMKFWKLGKPVSAFVLAAGTLAGPVGMAQAQATPATTTAALAAKAAAAGATHIKVRPRTDGGILLHGRMDGRNFVIDIPPGWQGQSAQFARFYTFPGMSLDTPKDLVGQDMKKDPVGVFPTTLYKRGYAVGQIVYDKHGMAIESGTLNNIRLKHVFDQIGSTQVLMTGISMGGSTVMSVIDHNPGVFSGALTACAVSDNWSDEAGVVFDMRALYNYFTTNTKYALPGSKDLNRDALSPTAPALLSPVKLLYFGIQAKRITSPLNRLFADAQKDPNGQAAHIIANIASASGSKTDPGSFTWRLLLSTLGTDDIHDTYGGNIYGNRDKVYRADALSAAENETLNLKISRVDADPAAVERAAKWHASTGQMTTPTITLHNRYDALTPYSQETGLQRKVGLAGNDANLLQLAVPGKEGAVLLSKYQGYMHCGFTPEQVQYEVGLADQWARTKQKPEIKGEYKP
jgi:hypothetical protein